MGIWTFLIDEVLKYFGARSSSSLGLLFASSLLFWGDKGLQFISMGVFEESSFVCRFDFFDLDFLGGLLYFDWLFELLSFFSSF